MNKLALYIAFLLCGVLSGCNDFLTENDPSQITNATFWKTAEDAERGITAAYNGLKQTFLYNSQGFKNLNCRADDNVARLQNPQIYGPDLFTNDPSNTFARDMWKACYVLIFRANQVIDNVPLISMNETRRNEIVLEAKFLRGLSYFILATNYRQVPIVLSSNPEDKYPAKASVEELWQQIASDFTEAKGLPQSYPANKVGHATSWAAQAYLGKTYLYLRKWKEAATELENIMSNGNFTLMADVNDNWGSVNENNQESLFEVQYMYSTVSPQINDRASHFAPAEVGGYYVAMPSKWIFKEFQKEKTVDNDFDLRMYGTFFWNYEGAEIYQLPFTELFKDNLDYVAWKKYQLWDKSVSEASLFRSEINERLMRYAHVLLMYAEAENELGNTAKATDPVNQIRTRANLSSISNLSQDAMREEIRHQRALEFCFEGERFFDIVRWGIGKEVFASNLERPNYVEGKHDYFPIPQEEIDANPNLTQNEFWK